MHYETFMGPGYGPACEQTAGEDAAGQEKAAKAMVQEVETVPNRRKAPRGKIPRGAFVGSGRAGARSARGAEVGLALRSRGQLLVGGFFLIQRLLQDSSAIIAAKLLGPRHQTAIARDLVVLDRLSGIDQCRVQNRLVVDLAGN